MPPAPLPLGLLDVEIRRGFDRYEAGCTLRFGGEQQAFAFLRTLADEPRSLEVVRAVLAEVDPRADFTRAGPHALLLRLAREVARGTLCIAARPPRRVIEIPAGAAGGGGGGGGAAAQSQAAAQSSAAGEAGEASPAPKPEPAAAAETTTDEAAQAETLKEAAKNGTPFCEECEKLRQAKAAREQAA